MPDDGSEYDDDGTPLNDAFGRINLVGSMGEEAHISDEAVSTVKSTFKQLNEHGESVNLVLCLSEFIAGFEPTSDVIASIPTLVWKISDRIGLVPTQISE
eukprot:scaffold149590_cov35-Attheya_sp.AAC.2